MRHPREPVQRRRAQTAVDEQRVVVAHEREADHADRVKYPRADDAPPRARGAAQVGVDARAFDEHGRDDDNHGEERKGRRACELVDVAVEREGERHAERGQ